MTEQPKRGSKMHQQKDAIQIQDNKEQFNISNITMLKKDQISMHLKRERSTDSSMGKRGSKQLNTIRPKNEKLISKQGEELRKAYRPKEQSRQKSK